MSQPGQILGILGGGQLGRMLALAAATLGIRPERLRVLWDDETSRFQVTGTVVERLTR